jgi:hypothetical protein
MLTTTPPLPQTSPSTTLIHQPSTKPDTVMYVSIEKYYFARHKMTIYV